MSGTVKGRIDCRQASGLTNLQTASTIFISMYKAMKDLEVAGYLVEAANFNQGAGFNYYNEASPTGTYAWALFRIPPVGARVYSVYIMLSHADQPSVASGVYINGINVNTAYGHIGVDFCAALTGGGADGNPWTGGTAKLGADARPNPVWAAPGGGGKLWVASRENSTGGAQVATMRSSRAVWAGTNTTPVTTATRWSIMMDQDSIVFLTDPGDDGSPHMVACMLVDTEAAIASACPFKHALIHANASTWSSADLIIKATATGAGTAAGTELYQVSMPYNSSGDTKVGWVMAGASTISTQQPSSLAVRYAEEQMRLFANEAAFVGAFGRVDRFLCMLSNLSCYNTLNITAAKQRLVVGLATVPEIKMSVPWDGVSTPQSVTTTRSGVTF